jgi:hypothetical protein
LHYKPLDFSFWHFCHIIRMLQPLRNNLCLRSCSYIVTNSTASTSKWKYDYSLWPLNAYDMNYPGWLL